MAADSCDLPSDGGAHLCVRRKWLYDLITHQNSSGLSHLLSTARAPTLTLGNGADIISAACSFILEHVKHELIFVTCFWTQSESLSHVTDLLLALSEKGLAQGRKVRVRICVSSISLMQKLFHTWSVDGKIYDPSEWTPKLQIPQKDRLAGLDLQIKSVFIPPFSVMHSKYIVIDRSVCLLPSCNVSWENWFEGCVDLRGPIVAHLVEHWESFWGRGDPNFSLSGAPNGDPRQTLNGYRSEDAPSAMEFGVLEHDIPQFGTLSAPPSGLPTWVSLIAGDVQAIFLPSPHHQNPRFRPFPLQPAAECPKTPLNMFILQALEGANDSIFMQTPNVTSPPVLDALNRALARGIDVSIVTNERLMLIEQLVTAGTTTPRCLKSLIHSYKSLRRQAIARRNVDGGEDLASVGKLSIEYFAPVENAMPSSDESWPIASHFKLTIIDNDVVVLGSGNMDRASWYTSQELGVALFSPEVASQVSQQVFKALEGRLRSAYAEPG